MTDPTIRLALTMLIASAISHFGTEIAGMNQTVRLLEKTDRARIMATYEDGQQWRGLASDDFTRMVETLMELTDGQVTFS